MRFPLQVLLLAASACNQEGPPVLMLEISSSLEIPGEANSLLVRLADGPSVLREESYPLGAAPRDRWPQTLPIIAGDRAPKRVGIVLELRRSAGAAPSETMGFAAAEGEIPPAGQSHLAITVPRACADEDQDGFGIGLGCRGLDCDDTRTEVPMLRACAPDAGPPPARDGGAGADRVLTAPDGGSVLCGETVCRSTQRCIVSFCFSSCEGDGGCPDPNQICVPGSGQCFCRVPCPDGANTCGPYPCENGCCKLH